jgi:hypothetical protein
MEADDESRKDPAFVVSFHSLGHFFAVPAPSRISHPSVTRSSPGQRGFSFQRVLQSFTSQYV